MQRENVFNYNKKAAILEAYSILLSHHMYMCGAHIQLSSELSFSISRSKLILDLRFEVLILNFEL